MKKLIPGLFICAALSVTGCSGHSHVDVVPVTFAAGKAAVGPFPAGITFAVHFKDSSGNVISKPFYQGSSAAPAVSLTVPPGAKAIEVYHRSSSNPSDNGFEYHEVK
jgi:hypothetical protein